MNCETVLKNSLNRLTGAEKAVADYILAHPQEVVTLSVQALAAKSKSSGSAVMRLVKKLGFDSYPALKLALAKTAPAPQTVNSYLIDAKDSLYVIAQKLKLSIRSTTEQSMDMIDFAMLTSAITRLRAAKTIYLIGVGASAICALDLQEKLIRINRPAVFHPDAHMQLCAAVSSNKSDIAIVFSYSGETKEVCHAAARHRENGAGVIGVTKAANSTLSKLCDYCFYLPDTEGELRLGAISSRYAQLFLSDLFYLALMQENFTQTERYILQTKKIIQFLK